MSWIFIEPTDVWLFRDGKPFDAGSDHRAKSLFPPNPTTIQGALRSKLLMASGASLPDFGLGPAQSRDPRAKKVSQTIGWPGEPPRFQLQGPFIAQRKRDNQGREQYVRYFPVPADVVKVKGSDRYRVLAPLKDNPFQANWPQDGLLPLWARTTEVLAGAFGWVDEDTLRDCLNSKSTANIPIKVLGDETLFTRESRFGVGLDSRVKRPQEGLLYQVEFIRPRDDVGLLVEVEDSQLPQPVQWPDDHLMSIGGESRSARYTVLDSYTPQAFPWPTSGGDDQVRLRVYFATPTWFAGGWTAADWRNWFSGRNLRLVAAAVRRARPIGGARVDTESQKGNFQKAMHRYVPGGSVFFFEADGPISYTGEPVTDSSDEGKIGFGQVLFGTWKYA